MLNRMIAALIYETIVKSKTIHVSLYIPINLYPNETPGAGCIKLSSNILRGKL